MKRILWALDPFETEAKPSAEFLHQVKEWLRQARLELQPVYILSIPRKEQPATQIPGRREFLENTAREQAESLGFSEAKHLQILFDGEADWKNATRKMADFTRRQDAVCIMVNSRGHS